MTARRKRPRVLLLLHELSPSGAPRLTHDLFRELSGELDLWTIALQPGELMAHFYQLGRVTVLAPGGGTLLIRGLAKWQRIRIGWLIRRWKPDVIYVSSVATLATFDAVALPDLPVILYVHELGAALAYYAKRFARLLRDRPSHYGVVSEAVGESLVADYGVNPAAITRVPACVSDALFLSAARAAQETGQKKKTQFIVGGSGKPGWVKGLTLWLLMAVELRKLMGDTVRFQWIGVDEGGASEEFRYTARRLGLEKAVEFIPFNDKPLERFAALDVFAVTSWEESASLVTLENMMVEVPVVCFGKSGGPPELLGGTGVVVESFEPIEMARAVADLARDHDRRRQLGMAARERVQKHFLCSDSAAILRNLITSEIAKDQHPAVPHLSRAGRH